MLPAFRSTRSVLAFCALLIFLLGLPVILSWIGLPPREEAWSGVSTHAGAVGNVVRTIYDDQQDVDVLFIGPSILRRGVDPVPIEQALSAHLGRPAHVAVLSMVWAGADLQYFLLRDYLDRHHPRLIVWNAPGPTSSSNEPHVQAYRWMRYGEDKEAYAGLPLFFRIQVYGEMVLGAPKELLYKLRPNMLSDQEKADPNGEDVRENINTGYHKASFVRDTVPMGSERQAKLLADTSSLFHVEGAPPEAYELNYLRKIVKLTDKRGCTLVLLHVPTDAEYGNSEIPEIENWSRLFGPEYNIIGTPATALFAGLGHDRFLHFFSDSHLNANGRQVFTEAIIPSILEAYDQSK
jgi:hypothetical protein